MQVFKVKSKKMIVIIENYNIWHLNTSKRDIFWVTDTLSQCLMEDNSSKTVVSYYFSLLLTVLCSWFEYSAQQFPKVDLMINVCHSSFTEMQMIECNWHLWTVFLRMDHWSWQWYSFIHSCWNYVITPDLKMVQNSELKLSVYIKCLC